MDAKHASLAVAIVVSGQHLGTATAQGAYPLIAERATWEAPFYLIGILGCTWALVWMNLISSNPPPYFEDDFEDSFVEVARDIPKEASTSVKTDPASPDHPVINNLNINVPASPQTPATPLSFMDDEAYVNDEFEPLILSFYSAGKSQMPWYRFFRFPSVWAYFCVFFAYNWSFYLLVSYLPKFLTSILGFTMKEAGEVGLWAYLGLYCSILVGGRLNSHFISKGYSPTVVRKVGVSLGLIPAMLLILAVTMPWFELTSNQISKCLLLSISLTGFAQSSFAPNPIDLAPTSPAFIASLGNMVATLPGIFSSLFTGHILEDVGNCHAASNTLMSNVTKLWISDDCYAAWMIIFRVCVGVYFSGWIVWVFFSRARPLPRPTPVSPIHLQL